jgi:serine phosphatase RsbU (regulator of sigma subunit)/ABC-type amino acid transport substrate-binding protein
MNLKFLSQLVLIFIFLFATAALCSEKEENATTLTQSKYTTVVELVKRMSSTVHYLQQERGASSGYISSKGQKFQQKLQKIEIKTDEALASLLSFLDKNQKFVEPFLPLSEQKHLRQKLSTLPKLREGVKRVELNFAQIYSKYTQIIAYLLLNISNISEHCEATELREELYSYVTLLMYKESLDEKRAALSALFSQESFSEVIFEYFLTADTQEAIYFKSFLHMLDDEVKEYYYKTVKQKTMQEVAAYEKLALEKMQGKEVIVKPEEWFESITEKINHIQKVEEKLLEKIEKVAKEMDNSFGSLVTMQEREWLKNHPVIKYAYDPDWRPLEWQNGISKHTGMIADVLKIIENKSGIHFQETPSNTWKEAYSKIVENSVDMISAMAETSERKKYVNFTQNSVFSIPYVVVGLKGVDYSSGFDALKGKKLAFVGGYVIEETLKEKHKDLEYTEVTNVVEGLDKILKGEIDALLINLATANYFLRQREYKDLQVAYRTNYTFNLKVALAKSYPKVALNVIDKALAKISEEQKEKIYERWARYNERGMLAEEANSSKISVFDILPLKEMVIILVLLLSLSVFVVRFLSKRDSVKLGVPIFIFGFVFVVISVFIVVSAVSNLKKSQKEEIKNSLLAISRSTNTALQEWYESKKNSIEYTVQHTPKLHDAIVDLLRHKEDLTYLKEHQKELNSYEKNVKDHFPDRESYFVVTKEYKVLGSSLKELVGKDIELRFAKRAIDSSFNGNITLIHPRLDKKDRYKIFTKLYFLIPLYDSMHKNVVAVYATGINPIGMINILQQGQIGETGETYVINDKAQLISQSRFDDELRELGLLKKGQHSFLNIKIAYNNKLTLAAQQLLKGEDGYSVEAYRDYRGIPVFGAWKWDHELHYGLITEVDEAEAMEAFTALKETIYGTVFSIVGFVILLLAFLVWFFNQSKRNLEKKNRELEEWSLSLERKVEERTHELHEQKEFVQTLLDSQEQLIVTTEGETIISVNKTFLEFYEVPSIEGFKEKYNAGCICETFDEDVPPGYLKKDMGELTWIDHVLKYAAGETQKVRIIRQDQEFIFSVTVAKLPGDKDLKSAVFTNITEIEKARSELELMHKHTKESIEYASLIQGTLIPEEHLFDHYFKDHFSIWLPKDTVGGDIYLFESLRNGDEALLMVIDCTGHGVPGAFVTMLVKAIERQIVAKINHSDEIVSPAKILRVFNKNMKQLLKQEQKESLSNAGFDGAVLYYNKKENIVKFAGAEIPLFYVEDDELQLIKGDRYSVGYKTCDINYEYKEHLLDVSKGMSFYLTTDGFLDQNGGEKGFPFGKKRFMEMIRSYKDRPMREQKELFLQKLREYQGNEEQNDDITVVGLKV